MIEEIFDDRTKQLGVAAGKRAGRHEIDDFAQRLVLIVMVAWAVTARVQLRDLHRGEAEEEKILRANFLADFDVRAVERSNGERAVEGELHVARAACFFSRSGNLLGQIRSGID